MAQVPDSHDPHTVPMPGHVWQHRCLEPLVWQKPGEHASALAEGRSSSKIELPSRPMDCRIAFSVLSSAVAGDALALNAGVLRSLGQPKLPGH